MPQLSFLNNLEIGLGTWAWGDGRLWGFGRDYGEAEVRLAFESALAAGVRLFDTAEVYGQGQSESILGSCLKGRPEKIFVATKFMPYPWRFRTASLLDALKASLARLGLKQADLYQIHWPVPVRSIKAWMRPMAEAVKQGLAREAGVSNYNASQMRRAAAALEAQGVALASNQVEYSLIHRKPEFNGLLDACRELNVRLIAYSPLGMGMLSGKYTPSNPPPGIRGLRYRRGLLEKLVPLLGLMKELGQAHGGKTMNQVALNWLICKGALPIPGAKNSGQAAENAGAAGWRLDSREVAALDQASLELSKGGKAHAR